MRPRAERDGRCATGSPSARAAQAGCLAVCTRLEFASRGPGLCSRARPRRERLYRLAVCTTLGVSPVTRHSDPKASATGKVIPFPRVARPLPPPVFAVEQSEPAASPPRRIRHWDQWGVHLWLLAAWLVAFDHLQQAVARHAVFGPLDSLAFLVAVVMPILRIRALLEWFNRTPRPSPRRQRQDPPDTSLSA